MLNRQYTSYQQRKEQSNQPHSTDRRQSSLAPTPLPKHPPTPTPKDRLRHFLLTLFAVNHPPLHLLETHYYSAFFLLLFFFFFFFDIWLLWVWGGFLFVCLFVCFFVFFCLFVCLFFWFFFFFFWGGGGVNGLGREGGN